MPAVDANTPKAPAKKAMSSHTKRYAMRAVDCQITGCAEKISDKAYFKRYKICLYHFNLPSMVLDGRPVRWCQQCGRFQPITDFDGDKRTCRARLDKHNERRRGKPKSGSALSKQRAKRAAAKAAGSDPDGSSDDNAASGAGSGGDSSGRRSGSGSRASAAATKVCGLSSDGPASPAAQSPLNSAAAAGSGGWGSPAQASGQLGGGAGQWEQQHEAGVCPAGAAAEQQRERSPSGAGQGSPQASLQQQQQLQADGGSRVLAQPATLSSGQPSKGVEHSEHSTLERAAQQHSVVLGQQVDSAAPTARQFAALGPIAPPQPLEAYGLPQGSASGTLWGPAAQHLQGFAQQAQHAGALGADQHGDDMLLSPDDLAELVDWLHDEEGTQWLHSTSGPAPAGLPERPAPPAALPSHPGPQRGPSGGSPMSAPGRMEQPLQQAQQAQHAPTSAFQLAAEDLSCWEPPGGPMDWTQGAAASSGLGASSSHPTLERAGTAPAHFGGLPARAAALPHQPSPPQQPAMGLGAVPQGSCSMSSAFEMAPPGRQPSPLQQSQLLAAAEHDPLSPLFHPYQQPRPSGFVLPPPPSTLVPVEPQWVPAGSGASRSAPFGAADQLQQQLQQPGFAAVSAEAPAALFAHDLAASGTTPRSHPGWLEGQLVRVSLKLFDVTPDKLAPHVKEGITRLVAADPAYIDHFVRPGCTHVSVSALLSGAQQEQLVAEGAKGLAQRLLGCGPQQVQHGDAPWWNNMLVQLGSSVAVVRDGQLVSEVDVAPSVPRLALAHPPALLVGSEAEARQPGVDDTACEEEGVCQGSGCCGAVAAATAARGRRAGLVTLIGRNIADSHDVVICTQNGRVLDLEMVSRGVLPWKQPREGAGPPLEWVTVRPLRPGVGLLEFEVQRGAMLSAPLAVLGLPSAGAVKEAGLAQRSLAGTPGYPSFLQALGLALQLAGPLGGARVAAARLATRLLRIVHAHGWAELQALLEGAGGVLEATQQAQQEQQAQQGQSLPAPVAEEAAQEVGGSEEGVGAPTGAEATCCPSQQLPAGGQPLEQEAAEAQAPPEPQQLAEEAPADMAQEQQQRQEEEEEEEEQVCCKAAGSSSSGASGSSSGMVAVCDDADSLSLCKLRAQSAGGRPAVDASGGPVEVLPEDELYERVVGDALEDGGGRAGRAGAAARTLGIGMGALASALLSLAAAALAVRSAAGGGI